MGGLDIDLGSGEAEAPKKPKPPKLPMRLRNPEKDRREKDVLRMVLRVTAFFSALAALGYGLGSQPNEMASAVFFLGFLISITGIVASAPRD